MTEAEQRCYALATWFLGEHMNAADPRFDALADEFAQEFMRQATEFVQFRITHAGTPSITEPYIEALRRMF